MGAIATTIGSLGRPLALGLLMLIGLGLLSEDPTAGHRGADGFDCRGFTDNPDVNRALCRLSPSRIWNTPVGDLVPWLTPNTAEPAQ